MPLCAVDQVRIFSCSGSSKKYPPLSSSSYGKPAGILGINCGHHEYPYIEGVSIQRYFLYEQEENDRLYKLKQGQRELEREVRKLKNECSMLDKVGDKEGFSNTALKLKSKNLAYKEYCSKNSLTPKKDRLPVSRAEER